VADADISAHSKFLPSQSEEAVAEMMEYEFILSFGIISSFVIRHSSFFR